MAHAFDHCEFWLPPQFLNEDGGGDSVASLTDSESDEDDYIFGLTRRMAHSTLQEEDVDEEEEGHGYGATKVRGLSGSPKSPLFSSLEGLSEEAGGKKRVEEFGGLFPSSNAVFAPLENSGSNFGYSSAATQLSYQRLQAARFEHLKREHMLKEQRQGGGVWIQKKGGCGEFYQMKLNQQLAESRVQNGGRRQSGLSSSAWPTLQQSQQNGSGMRAVFLGNPGANKERNGTGVFLPRSIGSIETRKNKSGCSTVLIPERVVQSLNLNLETLDAKKNQFHPRNIVSASNADEAALKCGKKNQYNGKQRQNREKSTGTMSQSVADEVRLPPEWIY